MKKKVETPVCVKFWWSEPCPHPGGVVFPLLDFLYTQMGGKRGRLEVMAEDSVLIRINQDTGWTAETTPQKTVASP